MIVIGPPLNTGIGHHAKKYTNVFQIRNITCLEVNFLRLIHA